MRQVLSVFVAVVFALSLAGVATAQGTQTTPSGSAPAAGGTQTEQPKSSTDTGKATADQPKGSKPGQAATDKPAAGKEKAPARTAGMRGQHRMMGEVTKIDAAKGMVSVKTDEGDMDLHFPPSALQGLKEGDRVEVQLAIRPAAGGPASKGSDTMGKSKAATPQSGKPAKPGDTQQPKTQ